MPGSIVHVSVEVGQHVTEGQELLVVEAMKMQNTIFSQHQGIVSAVLVSAGDEVRDGQALVEIVDS